MRPATEPRPSTIHLLAEAAEVAPDRLALVCGRDRLTYAQYAFNVAGVARYLSTRGAGPGTRVALLMSNSVDAAVATFAVQSAGAQVVPLNPGYTTAELAPIFANCEPVLILHDETLEERVQAAAPPGAARVSVGAANRLASARTGIYPALTMPEPESFSTLQFTGGTTGRVKGVELTHRAVATNVAQRQALLPALEGEAVLAVTPLFHVYALAMGLYLAVAAKGTLHLAARFDAETVLATIERERIGFLSANPTAFLGLMSHPKFTTTNFEGLRVASSGSAALPAETLKRWEESTGCPICEGYGQTEAGPVLTYNPLSGPRRPGTVGRPVPGTELEIVDIETGTKVLPVGETGEIRARGPQLMTGYRNEPAATAEALRDGWLYTGDIGVLDADGYLSIRDRKKEMVICAGYNVYPREVEEALFAHPGVADAAVVGVPDEYRGEALVAFVTPANERTDEETLREHIAARLVKYKWPREYRFVDALPKTAVGKTDKSALRNRLADPARVRLEG